MATKDELNALRKKLENVSTLSEAEKRFLFSIIDNAKTDVVSDADLDAVAGGARPRAWVQAGCFGDP